MKRAFRVKAHRDFDRIIKNGSKVKTKNFALSFLPAASNTNTRIGIAVGKNNGKAVTRVKEKRQVRAILAKRGDYTLPIDLIIAIRPCYKTERFAENEIELNQALDEIRSRVLDKNKSAGQSIE